MSDKPDMAEIEKFDPDFLSSPILTSELHFLPTTAWVSWDNLNKILDIGKEQLNILWIWDKSKRTDRETLQPAAYECHEQNGETNIVPITSMLEEQIALLWLSRGSSISGFQKTSEKERKHITAAK
ncbi:hypothetical protein EI555_004333 [Monodon monoceros]|uniref:Uncharacterized protein n=1 Tax=Monodon monoceros TaxID=40151 RepID=A0A4U1F4T0_MONMO|nr:hypothetical protein EI555_004333 [Monodon monoceros]